MSQTEAGGRLRDRGIGLEAVHTEVALVSVGEDNDYGHPNADLIRQLERSGTQVHRTDAEGDLAVVAGDGDPEVSGRE